MIPRFRAWDEKNKEMFKDTFAVTESGAVVTIEQEFITNAPDYIFVDHLTLMQSTGLTDKDGKEIFEGDVLCDEGIEQENDFVYATVSYREGMWVCDQITSDDFGYGGALNEFSDDYSVIGNIYENPKLLEVKK